MSATNRGSKRRPRDYYETPAWLTEALFAEWTPSTRSVKMIVEPAAGAGAISDVVRDVFPGAVLHELDIAPQRKGIARCNTLRFEPTHVYDLCITNPPYRLAEEFVRWGCHNARVTAMLLRLSFLGSQKRAAWLRDYTPSVYVTPRRPKFIVGRSGDNCEYAWLIWDRAVVPTVRILRTEQ